VERDPQSHKTENGIVAIIGGSRVMHGAPLFTALAAESSGVDLVHIAIPACHTEVTKATSLNFQVHPFAGNDLAENDTEEILELLATMDCAVLGPGVDHANAESKDSLLQIAEGASCALVLDAAALQQETLALVHGKQAVLTPHLGELERMGIASDAMQETAKENDVTIVFKGPTDRIISPDGSEDIVEGGNAGLTVGGSGDVLAGLIAGLIAQKIAPSDACKIASTIVKRAGEELFVKRGYAYTARDVIEQIPQLLHKLG